MKEFNFLILGETGVGKSTWINGFHNYLTFPNLKHAIAYHDFPVLIPSAFTFIQDGEEIVIEVGDEDPNERRVVGKSCTKEPRSYVFTFGDKRFRLIDTPGIGDTAGIEQDKKNMESILSYLTQFTEINAICILLKPNNSRLNVTFRFCIQELLVQLHNSAKNNIVFCFTNARQTFYRPGDTLPVLNEELTNRNVGIRATRKNYFCFDNEPFRFLACIKNGIQFIKSEVSMYSSSWARSVEEIKRLLVYVERELTPHNLRETLGVNETRRNIIAMSKPLAIVAKTISQNVAAAVEVKEKLDSATIEMSQLMFKGYDVERIELDSPRTVCANPMCVKYIPIGKGKQCNIIYDSVCHEDCDLKGVLLETFDNEKLRDCQAMNKDGHCRICNHSFKDHMHVAYTYTTVEKEFFSPHIQAQIFQASDNKSRKEALRNAIRKQIQGLRDEENLIITNGAKFGSFVKKNALIAYNDAISDYIDVSIKEEKDKPGNIRNENLVKNLTNMKEEYDRQVSILDNIINQGTSENIPTAKEVDDLRMELMELKHFGRTLSKLFEDSSIERSPKNEKVLEISNKFNFQEGPISEGDEDQSMMDRVFSCFTCC